VRFGSFGKEQQRATARAIAGSGFSGLRSKVAQFFSYPGFFELLESYSQYFISATHEKLPYIQVS